MIDLRAIKARLDAAKPGMRAVYHTGVQVDGEYVASLDIAMEHDQAGSRMTGAVFTMSDVERAFYQHAYEDLAAMMREFGDEILAQAAEEADAGAMDKTAKSSARARR